MSVSVCALPGGGHVQLAQEVPVALVYDGVAQAVMMASPADLEDFALGFALSEGLIDTPDEITHQEIAHQEAGIEARSWLVAPAGARFAQRRRATIGPVGCGLCGIEQLEQALRRLPHVAAMQWQITAQQAQEAIDALRHHQPLQDETRAAHASAFWQPGRGIVALREDVGRHNALDKLIGALARAGIAGASGALVMTSRLSVDLVQKAACYGIPVIAAPSAPTALAVSQAKAAGLTLIARAGHGLATFTQPQEAEI